MTSQQIANISEQLLAKLAETGSMRAAFDAIMGEGAYEKLAGEIYDAINAK